LTYLNPPPAPAPVVVVKDVGGLVTDYQARTEEYRTSGREVRLHECRSACTLALSLPNVCVYPDSILKFHQAYNENTKIRDMSVSAELFNAYPPAVRARLGTLTREYHVLRGAELIKLGIRDCNEPRIMVASVGKTVQRPIDQETSVTGMMQGLMSRVSGAVSSATADLSQAAPQPGTPRAEPKLPPSDVVFANAPTPPPRPTQIGPPQIGPAQIAEAVPGKPEDASPSGTPTDAPTNAPLPPRKPETLKPASIALAYSRTLPVPLRLRIMGGAAPILASTTFVAFAQIPRWPISQ